MKVLRNFLVLPLLGTAILFFAACETTSGGGSGASSGSTSQGATKADSSLALGKQLYYGRCTSCHAAEPPSYYTIGEWREMVSHMKERAKLTSAETSALLKYLAANAARG